MSDSSVNNPAGDPELGEMKRLCTDLQAQANIFRIVLLLVLGSLCLFFWREAGYHGRLVQQLEPQVLQASQIANALSKQGSSFDKQVQALQAAVARLADYGKSHPDYVPILSKYGVPVTNPAPPAAAPATPKK